MLYIKIVEIYLQVPEKKIFEDFFMGMAAILVM